MTSLRTAVHVIVMLVVTGIVAPVPASGGPVSPAELDATLCYGLQLQLEEFAERQSQILDGWGAHNSKESAAQSKEVEARKKPLDQEFSARNCADRPVMRSRQ